MNKLEIINLHVSVDDKPVLKGVNMSIKKGEMHVIMGPNGSGKSTLCMAMMGHPSYKIIKGRIMLNGKDITNLPTDKRALAGIFLGFQYPNEIPGITFGNFLRHSLNARNKSQKKELLSVSEFYPQIFKQLQDLQMDTAFIGRGLNEGFSGGEKKRGEIVQMSILKPNFAILDEIDSGLDIDALRITAKGIQEVFKKNKMGLLLITHYERILKHLTPDKVHVFADGKIVESGGNMLVKRLEIHGYKKIKK